jgi:hypothetical protein
MTVRVRLPGERQAGDPEGARPEGARARVRAMPGGSGGSPKGRHASSTARGAGAAAVGPADAAHQLHPQRVVPLEVAGAQVRGGELAVARGHLTRRTLRWCSARRPRDGLHAPLGGRAQRGRQRPAPPGAGGPRYGAGCWMAGPYRPGSLRAAPSRRRWSPTPWPRSRCRCWAPVWPSGASWRRWRWRWRWRWGVGGAPRVDPEDRGSARERLVGASPASTGCCTPSSRRPTAAAPRRPPSGCRRTCWPPVPGRCGAETSPT